jgi:trimethylamine--corrinoid protein Co-methyltransferase
LGGVAGGQLDVLGPEAVQAIDAAAREVLDTIGMAEAPPEAVDLVTAAGGTLDAGGRLLFPRELVDRALAGIARDITLCGQDPAHDLRLGGARVHLGTGGAAPLMLDMDSGDFRPSTLADLFDAARLVDRLDHVHFFSRSVVARDMPDDRLLDLNTAYAALAGTAKHVMTSASSLDSLHDVAELCFAIAGGAAAFRARPFLSLNINHVVPPLRFDPDAAQVLMQAARLGIPVQVNTFSQMGASAPVTVAGCVVQAIAETLAGVILAWLAAPDARIVFGPRPMVTDLRTGGMAGGSGEQALLTAAAVRMARHYELASSTIAGATDSKQVDAQTGAEKALAVTLAAHSGANLVTQSCGMLAGLMACSLEAYVVDNDMLGAILRSLSPVQADADTLSVAAISEVARGEGHFLGHADTYRRMQSDFLYPDLSDRRSPEEWLAAGRPDLRDKAKTRVRHILDQPCALRWPADLDADLRARFDIRLPTTG